MTVHKKAGRIPFGNMVILQFSRQRLY